MWGRSALIPGALMGALMGALIGVLGTSCSSGTGSGTGPAVGGSGGSVGGSGGTSGAAGSGGLTHTPEWLIVERGIALDAVDVGADESSWKTTSLGASGDPSWSPNHELLLAPNPNATLIDFRSGAPGDKVELGTKYQGATWAPSSARVVLASIATKAIHGADSFSLQIFDPAQPSAAPFIETGVTLSSYFFAPKSDFVAVLEQREGSTAQQLVTIDLRPSPPTRALFHEYVTGWTWAWSPTADELMTALPEFELVPLTPSGLGTGVPVALTELVTFRWWANGSGVVAQTTSGLRAIDVANGKPSAPITVVDDTGIPNEQFLLSPDGAWVVYLAAPGYVYPSPAIGEIRIARRNGAGFSAPETLLASFAFDGNGIPFGSSTAPPACTSRFIWSPDGKSLTFHDNANALYWVDTSGTKIGAPVLLNGALTCRAFSRDGSRLAFATPEALTVSELPLGATPTEIVPLAPGEGVGLLEWSISGKLAYVLGSGDGGQALYVVNDVDTPSTPREIALGNGANIRVYW